MYLEQEAAFLNGKCIKARGKQKNVKNTETSPANLMIK